MGRRAGVGILAVGGLVLAAGCAAGFETEAQMVEPKNASAEVGELKLLNGFAVASTESELAILSVTIVAGDTPDALTGVTVADGEVPARLSPSRIPVPAGESVTVGLSENPTIVLTAAGDAVRPGSYLPVTFSFDRAGTVSTPVPVHASEGPYVTITPPTPEPPSPPETPTATTPTGGGEEEPEETPTDGGTPTATPEDSS